MEGFKTSTTQVPSKEMYIFMPGFNFAWMSLLYHEKVLLCQRYCLHIVLLFCSIAPIPSANFGTENQQKISLSHLDAPGVEYTLGSISNSRPRVFCFQQKRKLIWEDVLKLCSGLKDKEIN